MTDKNKIGFFYNALLVMILVLALTSAVQGVKNAIVNKSADFQYDSAMALSMRINPYDETLSPSETLTNPKLNGLKEYYGKMEANQFPSLLFILTPYVLFSPSSANALWALTNIIMTIVILILFKKLFLKDANIRLFLLLSCLMLAGLGWRNNIGMGQHTIFSLAFFLLAVWLSEKGKILPSSLALAISFFKYTLTAPLSLYFVYKKKYKELFISVSVHILVTVFSAFWLKDSILNMISKPLRVSWLLDNQGFIDFGAIFTNASALPTIIGAVVIILCFILAITLKSDSKLDLDFFCLLCYISLIVVYHREYDFFVLIIPTGIYLADCIEKRRVSFECIISAIIFLHSNFVQRAVFSVANMYPSISWTYNVSKYILAITVYLFTAYLFYKCSVTVFIKPSKEGR